MLQFVVRSDGPESDSVVVCRRFPLKIGRGSSADLQIEAPGVWEIHAEVVMDLESGSFRISPAGEALLRINGEPCAGQALFPGDEIQMGGASLRVSLSPVCQKSVSAREGLVWFLFALVFLSEIALMVSLR